jgi:bla regulator protein blaR1
MSIEAITNAMINYGGLTLIHGSVLALITWLLSATLLRRSRPAIKAMLWTVVLVKFLLPPVFPGEMAMSGWITRAVNGGAATQPARVESDYRPIAAPARDDYAQDTSSESKPSPGASLLLFCYISIVMLLSIRALLALKRMRRRIQALPMADSGSQDEVRELATRIGLKRAPDVRATGEDTTPYVVGFRRAVLVLPERLMQILEPREREALILHELAHIRRKDQLPRCLQGLACILFFFFPPVRWVCRRVERFTEMACDRWAVTVSKVDPHTYANALVRVVKQMRPLPTAQAELSLVRGARTLEERLRAILRDNASGSPRLSSVAKAVMTGWALFVLAGGSAAESLEHTLNVPQLPATETEAVSPESITTQEAEPIPALLNARLKGNAEKAATASKQTGPSERLQSERAQHAYQEREGQAETDFSRQERLAAERRATQSQAQQGAIPHKDGDTISPYEEGFRLGKQYAEERAKRPQAHSTIDVQGKQNLWSLEGEAKREIEMRMQVLTRQPSRQ